MFFTSVVLLGGCSECEVEPTEDAMIKSAIEHLIGQQFEFHGKIESDGSIKKYPVIKYTSVEEFLEFNNNCCTFSRRGQETFLPSLPYRIINDYEGTVLVDDWKLRILTDSGEEVSALIDTAVQMNSCGTPIVQD